MTRSEELISDARKYAQAVIIAIGKGRLEECELDVAHLCTLAITMATEYQIAVQQSLRMEARIHELFKEDA